MPDADDVQKDTRRSAYIDVDMDRNRVQDSASDGDSGSSDSEFEGWDDETTLVAKLQDKYASEISSPLYFLYNWFHSPPQQSDRDRLISLANDLEAPMQAKGKLLKQDLARTIAPVAKKVKEVHAALEQKVDVAFGWVLLVFVGSLYVIVVLTRALVQCWYPVVR